MKREWLIAATMMGGALLDAGRLMWVCDDAFISYRYASHLVDGIGLVYNAGEYVEGYTNFLWTLLLSVGVLLGLSLPSFSIGLGLFCYGAALVGLAYKPHETRPDWFALLGGVCILHFRVFATSGLETMAMVACLIWALRSFEGEQLKMGVALAVCSVFIRPEGLALLGLAGLIWIRDAKAQRLLAWSTLIICAYGGWKLWYFGDLLPNTYYAKVDEPRWAQGLFYLWGSLGEQAGALLVFIAPVILWRRMTKSQWLSTALVVVLTVHVAKVGGDFMLGRFALPILACGLLLIQPLFKTIRLSDLRGVGLWIGLLFLPLGVNEAQLSAYGIAQERDWYPSHWIREAERQGLHLQKYLKNSELKLVIYGGQAMLGYYAQAPWILEGMAGLTDPELARAKARDIRVAHGAKVTTAYLQERGVHLYVDYRIQQPAHPLNWIDFGAGVQGSIMCYDAEKMAILKAQGAHFIDFPDYLDGYLDQAESNLFSTEQINADWLRFDAYYFRHTNDPIRQSRFEALRALPQ